MLTCQKEKFNLPGDITFLNSAYMGPNPISVERAGERALRKKSRPWEVKLPDFFGPVKKVRTLYAKLIGTNQPERIAVVSSVSYGVAVFVNNLHPTAAQNIVMIEEQFCGVF